MLFRLVSALLLIFALNMSALAEVSDQPATKRVRTLADRIGDRTLEEWAAAWSEYKSLANTAGADDGTTLVPYMNMGCSLSAVEYWDPKMVWVAKHSRGRNNAGRVAKRSTQRFRRTVADLLNAENKRFYRGNRDWIVMDAAMDLTKSADTLERDLQQRAELILLLNISWSSVTQLHAANPTDLEMALKSILFHKLGCDFADESLVHMDAFLESEAPPFESPKTELALVILTNAISDPALRLDRLRQLADPETSVLSADNRTIAEEFIKATPN